MLICSKRKTLFYDWLILVDKLKRTKPYFRGRVRLGNEPLMPNPLFGHLSFRMGQVRPTCPHVGLGIQFWFGFDPFLF
jgi:hypothetical protein